MAQPQVWRRIVENYAELDMTLEKDKLPALSGLAQRVEELRRDRYFAGLWSRTLVDDLCWKTYSPKGQLQAWRAPSWSWASVNGRVDWDEEELSPQDGFLSRRIYAADVDVIACEIVPIQEDQHGEVKSGFLTIRGKLRPAALDLIKHEDEPPRKSLNTPFNRIFKRLSRANPPNEGHTEQEDLQVDHPSSSIFSDKLALFSFYPDQSFDRDLQNLTGRLSKLRMYRNIDDAEETRAIYGAFRCHIGCMILQNGADGGSNYERIGWAEFNVTLIDDTAFPGFLDGETEEVITFI